MELGRFQISNPKFQIPDFRFQIPDFKSQISYFIFQISDLRFELSVPSCLSLAGRREPPVVGTQAFQNEGCNR